MSADPACYLDQYVVDRQVDGHGVLMIAQACIWKQKNQGRISPSLFTLCETN
jgi:hypothetical protein